MKEESIIRLLRSKNDDDQTIGIEYAMKYLGEKWCSENLNGKNPLDTETRGDKTLVYKYNNFHVMKGWYFIEYCSEVSKLYRRNIIQIE